MSLYMNKVFLIGNVGRKPDIIQGRFGEFAAFSLATSSFWLDRNTNQWNTATEWHRIVVYNERGVKITKTIEVGSYVFVEGSIKMRRYMDKQTNTERSSFEIIAENIYTMVRQTRNDLEQQVGGGNMNTFPQGYAPGFNAMQANMGNNYPTGMNQPHFAQYSQGMMQHFTPNGGNDMQSNMMSTSAPQNWGYEGAADPYAAFMPSYEDMYNSPGQVFNNFDPSFNSGSNKAFNQNNAQASSKQTPNPINNPTITNNEQAPAPTFKVDDSSPDWIKNAFNIDKNIQANAEKTAKQEKSLAQEKITPVKAEKAEFKGAFGATPPKSLDSNDKESNKDNTTQISEDDLPF
ncbi:single-stranded DNA-binding protein [Psittacicella hinzii]|uniref:Single-stranded DNA-binding protein n=1 Tax=Psittacicella hinzii TaxID=2028575 RepID=A0A3A1YFT4_9GAMM|nr:single-stranded DNA-binding protein [Psittacicella hinzii]RIY35084.1 hypothetical protein CKF58_07105 [Psittacicella hinzii]